MITQARIKADSDSPQPGDWRMRERDVALQAHVYSHTTLLLKRHRMLRGPCQSRVIQ